MIHGELTSQKNRGADTFFDMLIPIYLTDKGLQHVFMTKSYILFMEMGGAIDVFTKETFSVGQSNWRPVWQEKAVLFHG